MYASYLYEVHTDPHISDPYHTYSHPFFQGQVPQCRSGLRLPRLHTSTPQGTRQVYSHDESDHC